MGRQLCASAAARGAKTVLSASGKGAVQLVEVCTISAGVMVVTGERSKPWQEVGSAEGGGPGEQGAH